MTEATTSAAERLRWATVEQEPTLPDLGVGQRVTHPEFQGMEFLHVRAKSLLNEVPAAAGLPFRWTINVYRGCSHACSYCFARPSHTWLDLDAGRDFEKVVVVKVNAVERLRAELRRPSWRGEAVALGTNTDPYQRAEGRYRLTRGVVRTLADAGNPFSVLTKGTLVTRDLDVLADAAARGICTGVSMSIPTLDEQVWRDSEPGTPHPRARMETIAALSDAGVPTGVMVAPVMPGISDSPAQLEEVVAAAAEAGAGHITPILLHLRPGVREVFLPWLERTRPELVADYARWYRSSYAPRAMRDSLARRVRALVERHGPLGTTSAPRRAAALAGADPRRDDPPPGGAGEAAGPVRLDADQLSLL